MDEEYKQSEISKEVQRLMDEEGYEFGEAVKEAMSKGYKDGGLMVAIQKFNQGGNVIDPPSWISLPDVRDNGLDDSNLQIVFQSEPI